MSSPTSFADLIAPPQDGTLEVHLLGLVDFASTVALQERLVYEISGRVDKQGAILVCEHPPLITMGREATTTQLKESESELLARGVSVEWVARGGAAFVHAPGQLAIYPLLPLDRLGCDLFEFRKRVEEAAIAVCLEQRIMTTRRANCPGLWVQGGQVGFFGATVRRWVSSNGMFLNVAVEPALLKLLANPSGDASDVREGERSTSLQAQVGRPVSISAIREALIRHLSAAFAYDRTHVYTGHPLLQRTRVRIPAYV